MTRKSAPLPITFQAAITGPGFFAPGTEVARQDLAKTGGRRIAQYMPASPEQATSQALYAVNHMGATTVHIHPVEEYTGAHRKTDAMYAFPAGKVRGATGAVIANDASANRVEELQPVKDLLLIAKPEPKKKKTQTQEAYEAERDSYIQAREEAIERYRQFHAQNAADDPEQPNLETVGEHLRDEAKRLYLRFRLSGLKNRYPPDMFTILASNETAFFRGQNDSVKEVPMEFIQDFLKESVLFMNAYYTPIVGLAEISLDPGGIGSITNALAYLREEGIREGDPEKYMPRGLSISLLVGARDSFPIDPTDKTYPRFDLDAKTKLEPETGRERFFRILDQTVALKEEYNLPGPINFGTIVDNHAGPDVQPRVVWDWVIEWVQQSREHEAAARKFGFVIKAGLEECATRITHDQGEGYVISARGGAKTPTDPYTGQPTRRVQVDNLELLGTAMQYFREARRTLPGGRVTKDALFEIVTNPHLARHNLLTFNGLENPGVDQAERVSRRRTQGNGELQV